MRHKIPRAGLRFALFRYFLVIDDDLIISESTRVLIVSLIAFLIININRNDHSSVRLTCSDGFS